MSFASSSARTLSGKFDPEPSRQSNLTSPAFDDDRGDGPQTFQRFKGFGGGFNRGEDKERDPGARDFSDLRGGFSKRRDDSEGGGWTSVSRQPRKSFGADDGGDRERFRKELRAEGEKKSTPWDRDRPAKYDFGKERERGDRDRDHRPRGKRDESSWLLDDHRGERTRDNHREHNRYGGRVEKEPEWMDSDGKASDTKAAHSMEDFQRWKERMKASSAAANESTKKAEEAAEKAAEKLPESAPQPQPESRPAVERSAEEKPDTPARQASNPREVVDPGISLGRGMFFPLSLCTSPLLIEM